jgi:hypothetical protein
VDLVERDADSSERHPWEVSRFRFFLSLMERLEPGGTARILDVGSGDAWFARQLRAHLPESSSITCWDINYSLTDVAELGRSSNGLTLTAQAPEGLFGGILMLDVIEHVDDDLDFLRNVIHRSLADDGWLLISVPAYQSLFTSHDRWLKHYRRYSPHECRSLLRSVGLEVRSEGGLFHSLLPIRGVESVGEKIGILPEKKVGVGAWKGGRLATRALASAFGAEGRLSLWLGTKTKLVIPGLSYWAFCKVASTPDGH